MVDHVLEYLSRKALVTYRATTLEHRQWVVGLLRRGYNRTQLKRVVWDLAQEWAGKPDLQRYLRPSTLFRPSKFAEYLPRAEASWAEFHRRAGDVAENGERGTTGRTFDLAGLLEGGGQ